MEYLHCFANVSLVLRLMEYLENNPDLQLKTISVIHNIDKWIVRIKLKFPLSLERDGDFWAFLNELGFPIHLSKQLLLVFKELDTGKSPPQIRHRYRLVIVAHGFPMPEALENFRKQFILELGYCPPHLS
ncbi:MAG: hypothetical protein ACFB4I_08370 [Cyanophyceae cyanobacterium]